MCNFVEDLALHVIIRYSSNVRKVRENRKAHPENSEKKNEGNFAQNNFLVQKTVKLCVYTYVCLDTKNGLSKHVQLNIKI